MKVKRIRKAEAIAVTNSDFVHCNMGGWAQRKPWMARLTGPHPKWKLAREFLPSVGYSGKMPEYDLSVLSPRSIVEVNGGSTKNSYRIFLFIGKKYIFPIAHANTNYGISRQIVEKILGIIGPHTAQEA